MVRKPALIYCGGGNSRFCEVATQAGFLYGARLPDTIYGPLYFADQDWKTPNRAAYMAALEKHRPQMVTVLDWECDGQLVEVMDWAEEAAEYVTDIVIVPKVIGGISKLPRVVNGKRVVLGYSVPTKYAGTELPIWAFIGWPIHLLGGSPQKQMRLWYFFNAIAEVVSTDGNMMMKMAIRRCQFWVPGTATYAADRWWPMLKEADGNVWGKNAFYEAFRRSCVNIMKAWQKL